MPRTCLQFSSFLAQVIFARRPSFSATAMDQHVRRRIIEKRLANFDLDPSAHEIAVVEALERWAYDEHGHGGGSVVDPWRGIKTRPVELEPPPPPPACEKSSVSGEDFGPHAEHMPATPPVDSVSPKLRFEMICHSGTQNGKGIILKTIRKSPFAKPRRPACHFNAGPRSRLLFGARAHGEGKNRSYSPTSTRWFQKINDMINNPPPPRPARTRSQVFNDELREYIRQ